MPTAVETEVRTASPLPTVREYATIGAAQQDVEYRIPQINDLSTTHVISIGGSVALPDRLSLVFPLDAGNWFYLDLISSEKWNGGPPDKSDPATIANVQGWVTVNDEYGVSFVFDCTRDSKDRSVWCIAKAPSSAVLELILGDVK